MRIVWLSLMAWHTIIIDASTFPKWFQRSPPKMTNSSIGNNNSTGVLRPVEPSKPPYWLQRARMNGTSVEDEKSEKNDEGKQPNSSNNTAAELNTTITTTETTTSPPRTSPASFPRPHHPMFRQQPPGIVVMGRPPPQPASPVLNDALSQIISTMVRLGLVTWVSKLLRHQEEAIVPSQQFVWEVLNDKYERDVKALKSVLKRPPRGLLGGTWRTMVRRFQGTPPPSGRRILANLYRRTVIVVEMSTMAKPSDAHNIPLELLPDLVSFLIQQQNLHAFGTDKTTGEPLELEIVINMESPGGSATLFGKAAAELVRFRQNCLRSTLTVCVDQIAASGGYMMASQADRIIAAPFAIVGSIGVIRQGFNFYELAKRYGIQPLVLKAGDSKNPLSSFGPITRQDMELEQVRLKKIHQAFQDLVIQSRPQISARIMDGSIFSGGEAYELGLIDEIQTSDDYISQRVESGDRVLRLHRSGRKNMRRLSLIDLLPQLVQFDPSRVKVFVRLGTWLSFAHHLFHKYKGFAT